MLQHIGSTLKDISKVLRRGRGAVRQGWKNLRDECSIATRRLANGRSVQGAFWRPPLRLPTEPLPTHHVDVVISQGHVAMGPFPPDDNILPFRFRRYLSFLKFACAGAVDLEGEFVLALGDGHHTIPVSERPNLTFNRRYGADERIVLVPDVDFIGSQGNLPRRREVDRALLPWKKRNPQAIWRGSSTGSLYTPGTAEYPNLRINLCRAAASLSDLADIRLGRLVQGFEHQIAALQAEGILGDYLSPGQQITHRLVVSIDGNAGEWDGMFWKLYSGSTVLLVESAWEQWYSSLLHPWEHFVPVAADFSDLEERLHWCRSHDEECQAIGERARRLIQTEVTYEKSVDYVVTALANAVNLTSEQAVPVSAAY